jgi:hypothetical protein
LAVLWNFKGLQGLQTKRVLLQIFGPSEGKTAAEQRGGRHRGGFAQAGETVNTDVSPISDFLQAQIVIASEAKQPSGRITQPLGSFVASLLAMTD